ncbi:ABC transporter permease [Micromonospora lupini]|uniref:ABC transporter permease n=1 Tax=Micromonospora lupini TaxID=285679 RepID=UPI0033D7D66F
MSQAMALARICWASTWSATLLYRSDFHWQSWVLSWLQRLFFQVLFFGMLGQLVGGESAVRYLLIGNAVAAVAIEATQTIGTPVLERGAGALPLLVSAPGSHIAALVARGLYLPVTAVVSGGIVLTCAIPALGISLPWPRALWVFPGMLVIAFACYCYGTVFGALVLGARRFPWLLTNVSYLVLMTFCGVSVPVTFWPEPVQAIVQLLPVTHGLQGIRDLLDGEGFVAFLNGVCLELLVAGGWLALGVVLYRWMAESARRSGSIDLS